MQPGLQSCVVNFDSEKVFARNMPRRHYVGQQTKHKHNVTV